MELPMDQTIQSMDMDMHALDVLARLESMRSNRETRRVDFDTRLQAGKKFASWAKEERKRWKGRQELFDTHMKRMDEAKSQNKQMRKDHVERERQAMVATKVIIPPGSFIAKFLREERRAYLSPIREALSDRSASSGMASAFFGMDSQLSVIPMDNTSFVEKGIRSKPNSPLQPMEN